MHDACTPRTLQGEIWNFCYHWQYSCICETYYTPTMLHNLMFHPNPQPQAEPIQMSRMTFQCHRRASWSNDSVVLLLVLTGACRSL